MHEYVIEYYPGGGFHCEQIDGECGKTSEVYKRYKEFKKLYERKTGEKDIVTFHYNNSLWTVVKAYGVLDACRIAIMWNDILCYGTRRRTADIFDKRWNEETKPQIFFDEFVGKENTNEQETV